MRTIAFIANPILICLVFSSGLSSQTFHKEVLVDIPGANYDFDVFSTDYSPLIESYITWINKNDSVYTVYLKRISPEIGENVIIASDTCIKSSPKIAFGQEIKLVWQNYINNYYQIISCSYSSDSLSSKTIIRDSLFADPQISLSGQQRITWIENGSLFLKQLYPHTSDAILIDSLNCSSPDIIKDDSRFYSKILYIKEETGNYPVYLAEYNYYATPQWSSATISDGYNRNPQFGMLGGISFENFDQKVWKIKYTFNGDIAHLRVTNNESCNYKNSYLFSYGIATSSLESKTPFFVAFDCDSLENNNEVFIRTYQFGMRDSLINISNRDGVDYEPKVAYINRNDTVNVSIIWIHEDKSKSDIWIAREIFNPILGSVEYRKINPQSHFLFQNYPNPFNPTTTITYELPIAGQVVIKIYDINGRLVKVIANVQQPEGSHSIQWDGTDFNEHPVAAGVYICRLEFMASSGEKFVRSMKMSLVR